MKIKVHRCDDYWDSGTSRKIVPADEVDLSDELYLCEEKITNKRIPMGTETRICRLINGIRGSEELGYHFSEGWITVCPVDVNHAVFWGTRKSTLQKVEISNNTLLEILRET